MQELWLLGANGEEFFTFHSGESPRSNTKLLKYFIQGLIQFSEDIGGKVNTIYRFQSENAIYFCKSFSFTDNSHGYLIAKFHLNSQRGLYDKYEQFIAAYCIQIQKLTIEQLKSRPILDGLFQETRKILPLKK